MSHLFFSNVFILEAFNDETSLNSPQMEDHTMLAEASGEIPGVRCGLWQQFIAYHTPRRYLLTGEITVHVRAAVNKRQIDGPHLNSWPIRCCCHRVTLRRAESPTFYSLTLIDSVTLSNCIYTIYYGKDKCLPFWIRIQSRTYVATADVGTARKSCVGRKLHQLG